MTDINAPIDYPAKRKTHDRLHPVVFLVGWTVVVTISWVMAAGGVFIITTFLPEGIQDVLRLNFSADMRLAILVMGSGTILGILQRYLLNRAFHLRLNWWWVLWTPLGYALGFLVATGIFVIGLGASYWQNNLSLLFAIAAFAMLTFIPALPQWSLLHDRWRYSWLWIVGMVFSGAMMVFISVELWAPYRGVILRILEGIAHGVITGVTAIALDRLTRHGDYPPRKKQDAAG